VERLAADPARLEALCRDYWAYLNAPLERLTSDWKQQCDRWLHKHRFL
ncbi:MAG: alpha-L-fucosidase, partial [Gammaproteobacteria bacterium]|nr:alpha-L-fucosidase [Gammaproteobacteria bacterium]